MPAATGFMPDGAHARDGQRAQQRRGDDGLADAGIGAGDENAARACVKSVRALDSLTIGCPSAVRLGSPFHAWP